MIHPGRVEVKGGLEGWDCCSEDIVVDDCDAFVASRF